MTAPSVELLTTDPAAGLRAVAALIRERAHAASEGQWFSASREEHGEDLPWLWVDDPEEGAPWPIALVQSEGPFAGVDEDSANAEHLASFGQPAVALAVADWLDHEARFIDAFPATPGLSQTGQVTARLALVVARAYLTGEVPQ